MRKWLRDNYGWQAKKAEWATLVFCLLLAIFVLVLLVEAGG